MTLDYLNEPNSTIKRPWVDTLDVTPYYQETEMSQVYFEFYTREDQDSDDFQGTDIYYKIYNNLSKANSERSNLESIAYSSTQSGSATKMIETYGYQPLKIRDYNVSPLIPKGEEGGNQKVRIRLTDVGQYDTSKKTTEMTAGEYATFYEEVIKSEYASRIWVNEAPLKDKYGNDCYIPIRSNEKETSFNFGRTDEDDAIPQSGEDDVYFSEETTYDENTWFVNIFAVSVGLNIEEFTQLYSEVYYAGTVVIKSDSEDN